MICFIVLVSLGIIIIVLANFSEGARRSFKSNNLLAQKIFRFLSGLFGLLSIVAYLSLALVVPHIKQMQRMPLATFDCQANEISIENCQQQFSTTISSSSNQQLLDSDDAPIKLVGHLFFGDLNGNKGRLARQLDCLKYNHRHLRTLKVPTRFLLHKCGLICKPHRQHLHQFNDDLNAQRQMELDETNRQQGGNDNEQVGQQAKRKLVAPYTHDAAKSTINQDGISSGDDQTSYIGNDNSNNLVTLKICFSGESNGVGANYKSFCIENLTSEKARSETSDSMPDSLSDGAGSAASNTMTVGQLNAVLARITTSNGDNFNNLDYGNDNFNNITSVSETFNHDLDSDQEGRSYQSHTLINDRLTSSTHYVNPIVQFESHFKNFPHIRDRAEQQNVFPSGELPFRPTSQELAAGNIWCKFKPIPPFIVNNKPFSDIQCSLEREYSINTKSKPNRSDDRLIYLKKSMLNDDGPRQQATSAPQEAKERCSIQCKVNILYQVHFDTRTSTDFSDDLMINTRKGNIGDPSSRPSHIPSPTKSTNRTAKSIYLPLKPCLFTVGEGSKSKTTNYYLFFRSIADSSLFLTFIFVDLLLLIESIDTSQFHLAGKKARLFTLLIALTLVPVSVALLFDIITAWLPNYVQHGREDGYLLTLINESLIPTISDSLSSLYNMVSGTNLSNSSTNARAGYEAVFNGAVQGNTTVSTKANGRWANRMERRAHEESWVIVDSYLVPFFIYAILMFTFTLSLLKLPLFSLDVASLVRATSTEELGLAKSATDKRIKNEPTEADKSVTQVKRPLEQSRSSSAELSKANHSNHTGRNYSKRVVLFAMLTLFMGLQFNLSQICQTQILIETFDLSDEIKSQQAKQTRNASGGSAALWFTLAATHSSSGLFILVIALFFSDELSSFLADFSPVKSTRCSNPSSTGEKFYDSVQGQGRTRFTIYIGVSLITYALRYFILANLIQSNSMKWPMLLLFQAAELLNFPLTWFILTSRAHELIGQHPSSNKMQPKRSTRTLNVHLFVQSTLAFIYFILARFIALFIHTLHASLHLHSDNIDWFIETFYKENLLRSQPSQPNKLKTNLSPIGDHYRRAPPRNDSSFQQDHERHSTVPLFSPLPGERLTYLHASRLFVKYNSIICLIFGLAFLFGYIYLKYQMWYEARREMSQLERSQRSQVRDTRVDQRKSIVDRLSLDLANIKSSAKSQESLDRSNLVPAKPLTTMSHLPGSRRGGGAERDETDSDSAPRARIHFRYNTGAQRRTNGRHKQPGNQVVLSRIPKDDSSSHDYSSSMSSHELSSSLAQSQQHDTVPPPPIEFAQEGQPERPPTGKKLPSLEEEDAELDAHASVNRVTTRTRSKKVVLTLADDLEDWSLDNDEPERENSGYAASTITDRGAPDLISSPPPPQFADPEEVAAENGSSRKDKRTTNEVIAASRRISFAPTATLIHEGTRHVQRAAEKSTGSIQRARKGPSTRAIILPQSSSTVGKHANNEIIYSGTDTSGQTRSSSGTSSSARHASPEPSIDEDDDDYDSNSPGEYQVHRDVNPASGGKFASRKFSLGEVDSIENSRR